MAISATNSALHGSVGIAGVAVTTGILGFVFGTRIVGGIAGFWTEWMLPTFSQIYLYGLALCS